MKGFLTFLFLCVVITAQAQFRGKKNQVLKVRHVQGTRSFELGGGFSGYGIYGNAYFSEFFMDNGYWKLGGGYEYKVGKGDLKYSSIFADLMGGYTLLDKGIVFVNVLGGATVAMDAVENIDTPVKKTGIAYGPLVGAEFEWFVGNKVVFVINGTQRFIIPSGFGNRYYIGAALRFKL